MKDILQKKALLIENRNEKYNFIREFLQELILKIMDDTQKFKGWYFVGGTALHIIYDVNRYSEDLDFSSMNSEKIVFNDAIEILVQQLKSYGFNLETKMKTEKTVKSSLFKFSKILYETKLSHHTTENLLIKLDLDTNPPKGAGFALTAVNKNFLFKIPHYDLPSLFAGKLHAILCRTYVKGRDYYDFLWYLTKKIPVNKSLLENAYKQTQQKEIRCDTETLVTLLEEKLQSINFDVVINDVKSFIKDEKELALINRDILGKLIGTIEISQ